MAAKKKAAKKAPAKRKKAKKAAKKAPAKRKKAAKKK